VEDVRIYYIDAGHTGGGQCHTHNGVRTSLGWWRAY